jgi:K+-sensing histidine kinase KdpD
MTPYLYPGSDLGLTETHFELKRKTTTVGRHPNNEISLLLESISRFHAKIEQQDAGYILTDLNSSNGTFINGERIVSPRLLHENDVLTFGRADFIFSSASPEVRRKTETNKAIGFTPTHTSSVNIVGDEASPSLILSTKLSVESTPLPGSDMSGKRIDVDLLRKSNERLLTLYKLSEVIRASTTREEVLANVMELVFEVLPADRGVIMTIDPAEGMLEPQIVRFRTASSNQEVSISRTIVNKCMQERVAILSRDAKIDTRFTGSESIIASDIRSAMCVPLVSKSDLMGIFFIDTKESVRAFTEDDLAFFTSIANDLAITIDNITLGEDNIRNERLAAVGQTIAGLAHNIKNILQLARGGIELMDSAIQKKNATDVEAFWPVVRRGIDRMQSLTQEMLDYSRQTKPELSEANVNDVIEDTVRSFQQDHVEPGVHIHLQFSPDIPDRKIDKDGLFKSLMNLIGNAVDAFDGTGGDITISTSAEHETVYVKVHDNGRGIPKDKRTRIFQPFFTTKGSKGTGLGLSMTRKYIEDMFGNISVESEEGIGTTFILSFPPLARQIQFDIEEEEPSQPTRA